MPVIADTLTATQSAALDALLTALEAKRDALVEATGSRDWDVSPTAPCSRCGSVFLAAALHTVHGAGAVALVCRGCKRETDA